MQYQVPQFIEIEDKIVGPLTIKQFIYIAGTIGLCIVCFFYLPFIFSILLIIPIAALGGALAFYKINGKPFIELLEAGFNYYVSERFFLWKHAEPAPTSASDAAKAAAAAEAAALPTPKLTRGKLSQLALSLDVPHDQGEKSDDLVHGSTMLTPR